MTQQEIFGRAIVDYARTHNCSITRAADAVAEEWAAARAWRGPEFLHQSTPPGHGAVGPVPQSGPSQNGAQGRS